MNKTGKIINLWIKIGFAALAGWWAVSLGKEIPGDVKNLFGNNNEQ